MRSAERGMAAALLAAALGCGGGGGGRDLPDTSRNVVPLSVDGAHCAGLAGAYVNEPCVAVTVCTPGTQTCQTIEGILLDTGSFGLRVFQQVLTVSLPAIASGGGQLAECVHYGDGSSDWGPVRTAGVVLGGEPAVPMPIQVIDASLPGRPPSCTQPDTDPATAGFNGILGIGWFAPDCGSACAQGTAPHLYFSCSGSTCADTAVPVAQQVTNPVALLPQDNNGVVVKLPAVTEGGAPSAEGTLLLGIGTARNNVPGSVATLDLDGFGEFRTTVSGTPYAAFADTGSNALYFDAPAGVSIPVCASSSVWFCPQSTLTLGATNAGAVGKATASLSFSVANFDQLSRSSAVFSNLAGPGLGGSGGATPPPFDFGLPFFLGRPVYVGLEGRGSPVGTGPYVAH